MSSGVHALASGVDNRYIRVAHASMRAVEMVCFADASLRHGALPSVRGSMSSGARESCAQTVYSTFTKREHRGGARRGVCACLSRVDGLQQLRCGTAAPVKCVRAARTVGILCGCGYTVCVKCGILFCIMLVKMCRVGAQAVFDEPAQTCWTSDRAT